MNLTLVGKVESAISALMREAAEAIAKDEAVVKHWLSGDEAQFKAAVAAALPLSHPATAPAATEPVVEPTAPPAPYTPSNVV